MWKLLLLTTRYMNRSLWTPDHHINDHHVVLSHTVATTLEKQLFRMTLNAVALHRNYEAKSIQNAPA